VKLEPELVHIASMFNTKVFKSVSPIINNFPWSTPIGKELFSEPKPLDQYSDNTIASILSNVMLGDEISGFIELIHDSKSIVDPKQIELLVKNIHKYYKVRKVHQIVGQNSDDVESLLKEIKKIPDSLTGGIDAVQLGGLKPSEVIAAELGGIDNVIPTNFEVIRKSTPFNGYLPGQVVQVVGPPGRGKSALMLYEIVNMAINGYKILWVAMGDLMKYDFISRFTTVITGVEYYKVALDPDKYFTEPVQEVANNIHLITIPAGKISSRELVNYVDNSEIDYDIIVADYDSNFKTDSEASSYDQGGDTYNDLTELARPPGKRSRLVFIGAQPKIQYWEALSIPLEGAGESSRKQHIIDMMITLGTANSDRPAGIMTLTKVRRGSPNASTGYVMDEAGRFHEISREQLALMRKVTVD